jgi:adenosine deaminase
MSDPDLKARVEALPKVDLHRHLEGSIRLSTLAEIAYQYHIPLPGYDVETLRPYVQMTANDPRNLDRFLGKFSVLRGFYRSPEIVSRITREVIEDAAADNVRYLELRFTPYALAAQMNFPLHETIGWVVEAAQAAASATGIRVGLIASINRHERLEVGLQSIQTALEFRGHGMLGIDLAGREVGYPARRFGPMFLEAKQAGLGLTVHAGEWQGPENVRDAIQNLYTDRIGHGVRVVEDSRTAWLARDRGVVFEVCPTSNMQTGAVRELSHHPLVDMGYLDLPVTINTDDPAISGIALSDEYHLVLETFGYSMEMLRAAVLRAAKASFLPPAEKAALLADLEEAFAGQGLNGNGAAASAVSEG